jgi:hypothetical protein
MHINTTYHSPADLTKQRRIYDGPPLHTPDPHGVLDGSNTNMALSPTQRERLTSLESIWCEDEDADQQVWCCRLLPPLD